MSDDSYYIKPPGIRSRLGAGGVVARVDASSRAVLIALIRGPGHDEYVLPKGGVDQGETLPQAAAREIKEEAGFTRLECLCDLGTAGRLNGRRTRWQTTHYFLFLTDEVTPMPTEHAGWEVSWFAPDALPPMRWQEQKALIDDNRQRIVELAGGAWRR